MLPFEGACPYANADRDAMIENTNIRRFIRLFCDQQDTFGPAEIVNVTVALVVPGA